MTYTELMVTVILLWEVAMFLVIIPAVTRRVKKSQEKLDTANFMLKASQERTSALIADNLSLRFNRSEEKPSKESCFDSGKPHWTPKEKSDMSKEGLDPKYLRKKPKIKKAG
jgi:hypothetical protein